MDCKTISSILSVVCFILIIVLIVLLVKSCKSKEGFYRNELKNSMSMVSATNELINLDQTFGFFAGLNSDTKNPLLTSGCILTAYNNKDVLNSLSNYMYQLFTGKINEETFKKNVESLSLSYDEFQQVLANCRMKCNEPNDLSIFKITTNDFLVGYLVGLTIKKNNMMFPCFDLINYVQKYIYDSPIDDLFLYVNTMIQVNAGKMNMDEAMNYLKGRNVNVQNLIDTYNKYCSAGCITSPGTNCNTTSFFQA